MYNSSQLKLATMDTFGSWKSAKAAHSIFSGRADYEFIPNDRNLKPTRQLKVFFFFL
jgi:hypothetical protein